MPHTKHSKNVWGPALLFFGVGILLLSAGIPRAIRSGYELDEDMRWFLGFIGVAGFLLTSIGLFGALLAKRYSGTVATMSVMGLCAAVIIPVVVLDVPFRAAGSIAGLLALVAFWILPVPGASEGR